MRLTLAITARGVWVYQWSRAQLRHVASVIAGKSRGQARGIVLRNPGVQQVTILVEVLPADPARIQVLVLDA